jgi:drug/metabolite transporter (DMT)-like permease
MDKVLMQRMSSTQLQFWYMLFLVLFYLAYIIFTKTKIHFFSALKNYWIWILSIMFVVGDKALFIANQSPDSKVTIMTLLKQAGCIVTILAGKFVFKEKNIGYKLFCAGVIITGIVLSVAMK